MSYLPRRLPSSIRQRTRPCTTSCSMQALGQSPITGPSTQTVPLNTLLYFDIHWRPGTFWNLRSDSPNPMSKTGEPSSPRETDIGIPQSPDFLERQRTHDCVRGFTGGETRRVAIVRSLRNRRQARVFCRLRRRGPLVLTLWFTQTRGTNTLWSLRDKVTVDWSKD